MWKRVDVEGRRRVKVYMVGRESELSARSQRAQSGLRATSFETVPPPAAGSLSLSLSRPLSPLSLARFRSNSLSLVHARPCLRGSRARRSTTDTRGALTRCFWLVARACAGRGRTDEHTGACRTGPRFQRTAAAGQKAFGALGASLTRLALAKALRTTPATRGVLRVYGKLTFSVQILCG